MKKILKFVATLMLLTCVFWLGTVVSDLNQLQDGLIRLHVVADSDAPEDQRIKLQVRDAITEKLEAVMMQIPDIEEARVYIEEHLPELEELANQTLQALGSSCQAVVTFAQEAFPTRHYDTFSLPAGVYDALRVTIGSGEGKNWWCVIFPGLCNAATVDAFADTAAGAGFTDYLTDTLTGEPQYQIRFFVMDCIGWIQNWIRGF